MTSKRLFFNTMKEDLRHKLWLAALSLLANFLALPVAWLLLRSNMQSRSGVMQRLLEKDPEMIEEFLRALSTWYSSCLTAAGGTVALLTAVAVGLFGFRYVFHKKMVDTYHSLPVRRGVLYGAVYANGILIWFVPFFICLIPTLAMACNLAGQYGGGAAAGQLVTETLSGVAVAAVAYLLVYHLALIAVMLAGNLLNTLAVLGILGFGVAAFYGLWVAWMGTYLVTYYKAAVSFTDILHASPLLEAPYLLILRTGQDRQSEIWGKVLFDFCIAIALGMCAYFLHRRRASEAAGQGLAYRPLATAFRLLAGLIGGQCGWGLFSLLVSNSRDLRWMVFGAVLVGAFAYGVADVIFQMDFKAFFSHKIQQAVSVALSLALCFAFYGGWFGYDSYLPNRGDIAELSIYSASASNSVSNGSQAWDPLEGMSYRDTDAIYAFLERVARPLAIEDAYAWVDAKVTLKNGKSYYRHYPVEKKDRDVLWPILTSEEYLRANFLVSGETLDACESFAINYEDSGWRQERGVTPEIRAIVEAYNRDVLGHAEELLSGEGRLLAKAEMSSYFRTDDRSFRQEHVTMDIYDFMESTVEALREAGAKFVAESEVAGIYLPLYCGANATAKERISLAREKYGVPDPSGAEGEVSQEVLPGTADTEMAEVVQELPQGLIVTDGAEVAELFGKVSFLEPNQSGGIFRRYYTDVTVKMADGREAEAWILQGELPEKYILRFGE